VDDRVRHGNPYAAACFLSEWAAEHWDLIDGKLAVSGQDPLDMPFRRVLNVAYTLWRDGFDPAVWPELDKMLAWPEERAEAEREANLREQDASVRQSAAFVGANVDKMYERALAARREALDELARRRAQAERVEEPA
jgi:hypothetical protein